MTNEMKYLMHLYACAARSVGAKAPEEPVDYHKLYALAEKMSLLSTLSYALKISPKVCCPMEIKSKLYSVMLGTSLKNMLRMEAVLDVLGDIEQAGIKAVVLKGLDCARYYAKPECHISADTDLFIDEKDENKLLSFFEERGYSLRRREKHEHHSECVSSKTGMFEIHTQIWEDDIFEVMPQRVRKLKHCVANSQCVSTCGKQIRVLAPTDAMMFMTMHLVKHFVFSRASLKMSYDLALYYLHNKHQIDTEKYRAWVKDLGYSTIVCAVFSAMVLFCDFTETDFDAITCFDSQAGHRFAHSIEHYDSSDENQLDAFRIARYCAAQSNTRKRGRIGGVFHHIKNGIRLKLSLLFPKLSHLRQSYPYLQKHPYLYPIACIHRFFNRGTSHMFSKTGNLSHYNEQIQGNLTKEELEQIELLKTMNLV